MSAGDAPDLAVSVDPRRCVGSSSCVVLAPELFALDEHDRVTPAASPVPRTAGLELAERMCPTGAIRIGRPPGGDGD